MKRERRSLGDIWSEALAALLIFVAAQTVQSAPHRASRDATISQAVEYCSTRMAPTSPQYWYRWRAVQSFKEDRTTLCFDGRISDEVDLTVFHQLQPRGIAVVRSADGNDHVAMAIADLLWEKDVTVVIRDFCLSACAHAIAIASTRTIVLENSIVAWRELAPACPQSEVDRLVARAPFPCYSPAAIDGFLKRRGISGLHITGPPTRYANERVGVVRRYTLDTRSVFWMWHPLNHRDYFHGKLTYVSYPEHQEAVDAIVRRFGLHVRIVYDPDE
jgi:hypothetical protein